MSVSKEALKAAVKSVWIRSLTEIQPDILAGLTAARNQERSPRGREYLDILIQNALKATKDHTVICQDTGVPTFFIKTSLGFPYQGSLRETFDEAMREMTLDEFPMRPMVVHPLTRADRCDNTGANVPLLHIELDEGLDYMEITALPKEPGPEFGVHCASFRPQWGWKGLKNLW